MVDIEFNSSYARIQQFSYDVYQSLRDVLYWQPEGYYFSEAYRSGRWDGKYYLVNKNKYGIVFPTGLLSLASGKLKADGFNVAVHDKRVKDFPVKDLTWIGHDLRDYQVEARDAAIRATRGMWANATGSGKMLLAASFVQAIGGKATIAVLSKEALNNTADEFEASISGCGIGRWGGGEKTVDWITVTTHTSFGQAATKDNALTRHIMDSSVIIFDEAHHIAANTYYNTMLRCNAYYKIGMTGTPFRGDNKDLKLLAATGKKIYSLPTVELQERGFALKAKIRFIKSKAPDHVPLNQLLLMRADSVYRHGIMLNKFRNEMAIAIARHHHEKGDIVLLTVERAEHGRLLSEMTGWPYVDGSTHSKLRGELQGKFTRGEIRVLIASRIYNQSANFPLLAVMINLAGFSPKAAVIQKLGRVIRTAEGKNLAYMYDFYDHWESKLKKHSDKRVSYLKEEGHTVEVVDSVEDVIN